MAQILREYVAWNRDRASGQWGVAHTLFSKVLSCPVLSSHVEFPREMEEGERKWETFCPYKALLISSQLRQSIQARFPITHSPSFCVPHLFLPFCVKYSLICTEYLDFCLLFYPLQSD